MNAPASEPLGHGRENSVGQGRGKRQALADRDEHHRGRWGHERHDRGWHGHRRHFFYSSEPDVYYAPPPVVYTPAYPSPGINFVFPLRIQ
jgi:hypothetical protein